MGRQIGRPGLQQWIGVSVAADRLESIAEGGLGRPVVDEKRGEGARLGRPRRQGRQQPLLAGAELDDGALGRRPVAQKPAPLRP